MCSSDLHVSFADIDLRLASLSSLRERIVVVPQEGFLFGGTVLDNIRIARPGATDADVVAAVGWSQFFLLTFVVALPGLWAVWRVRERISLGPAGHVVPAVSAAVPVQPAGTR